MSWNFMDPASRTNLVPAWEREAEGMLAVVEDPEVWDAPTAAGHWKVRDVVGHVVDTTEGYFRAFDAARGEAEPFEPLGVRDMSRYVDEGARKLSAAPQPELVARLRSDLERMRGIADDLSDEDWAGLMVTHKYMGPLPACFYPEFQLVDYGVHTWDIRQGLGDGYGLDGATADLLAPVAVIVWQSTAAIPDDLEPFEIGLRITSGRNAGAHRLAVSPEGIQAEPGDVDDLTVLEFDPATLVLTAFGRFNGGTVRGDRAVADRFLRLFFRI